MRLTVAWAAFALAPMPLATASAAAGEAASAATPNATADSTQAADAGRQLYSRNCSHCHGFKMVNPGTVSFDLRKFPKDDPDRFFNSVLNGKGAMPAWSGSLTQDQVKLLWAYVQTGGKP